MLPLKHLMEVVFVLAPTMQDLMQRYFIVEDIIISQSEKLTLLFCAKSPTRHDLTQGQKPEGRLKWG